MKNLMTIIFLMTLSSGAMADLVLTVTTHQNTILKKIDINKFEKISQTIKAVEKLEKIKDGSVVVISEQESSKNGDAGKLTIEVKGKNLVKIEDEKEQVSSEVEATITRSLFGKLKGINIEAKTMDTVYAEAYKRTGLDFLKKMKLGKLASSEITTSDLKCTVEADLLKCDQDQDLVFTVNSPF